MDLIGKTTINPVLFYSGKFTGYALWVLLGLHYAGIHFFETLPVSYGNIASIGIIFVATIFVVLSLINLGKSTRLGLPTEATEFKTNGLYRISRNPMYVGFNLFTIASCVALPHFGVFLVAIYSMSMYHLIILSEERFLIKRFGKNYQNYTTKTRRYL